MERIHVNTDAIKNLANDLNGTNNSIKNGYDNMTRAVLGPLMNSWESPASVHAVNRFDDIRKCYYDNRFIVMENCAKFLRDIVGEGYDFAENNNASLSELFK